VRMRVDVWTPSPIHGRRRLEGGLVFLVGHCVDMLVGARDGWREHSDGNDSSTRLERWVWDGSGSKQCKGQSERV
jgi:hypothetical protein